MVSLGRLPLEAEWEAAALGLSTADGSRLADGKRRLPWGNEQADASRANLDSRRIGCVDVAALPAGDSAFGCRQMIGNVWEWCADVLTPLRRIFTRSTHRRYLAPRECCAAAHGRRVRA